MRTYRAKSGPFSQQPYYELQEVEQICADELRNVGLFPSKPEPIRIERFIEKRFGSSPVYEDLSEGILGFTEFGPKGVRKIGVSNLLLADDSKVSERRVSTTLAHEAGHGLLHAHLFVLGQQPQLLFGEDMDPNRPKILCRNNTIEGLHGYKQTGYDGCWWEYQANLAIGALLLPRSLLMVSLEPFLIKEGLMGNYRMDRLGQEQATRALVERFDVNPIVAKIRMEAFLPRTEEKQQLTF